MIAQANNARGSKVSAREEQDDHIAESMSILRQLDVVIRNKFAGNVVSERILMEDSHFQFIKDAYPNKWTYPQVSRIGTIAPYERNRKSGPGTYIKCIDNA